MKLIGRETIDTFKKKHSTSRKAFDRWVKLLENATFKTPPDVKNLFGVNLDFVGNQAVFDVGGNKVRTITKIQFGVQIILVTHVLTNEDYDKDKWRD